MGFRLDTASIYTPGWYGLSEGLDKVSESNAGILEILKKWNNEWTFFRTVLNNSQREMARTHLPTSALYNHQESKFHLKLIEQFKETEKWVTSITGYDHVLDHNKVIQNSILFRNPFTYPMNFIQAELLKRWKNTAGEEGKEKLTEALFLNINGIAAAMQSTG